MLLRVNTEAEGDTLRLTLSGELELSTVGDFQAAVEEAERAGQNVEIDMSDVVFMDSMGLQVLLQSYLRAREAGRDLALVRPSQPVRRLLELTGLDGRFAIRD